MKSEFVKNGSFLLPPKTACPVCESQLDGITPVGGTAGPKKGDVTICTVCGEILGFEFQEDGETIRELRPANFIEMSLVHTDNPWMLDASAALKTKRQRLQS